MEMCPYCGEDVPGDSTRCWKCGTELSASDSASAAAGPDGAPAIEERQVEGKGKKKPTVPCPHCEAPVSIYALRCNECGRSIGRPGRRINWGKASWIAFAVVSVGLLVGVTYSYIASRVEPEDLARRSRRSEPITLSWIELERIYFKSVDKAHEERRRERWDKEFKGEFIHWQGIIVNVDESLGMLELTDGVVGTSDKPQVRLALKHLQEVRERGLKRGMSLAYSARLANFDPKNRMVEVEDGTGRE